eukprot:TRINITY_DN2681_c0_g1_i2.p1 TRINITY_DN2681_c0_g1~~TRINITY_DN2681_c0_g1_i2.p1  ORF type:complete len:376 (-),score=41.88 TRINITY_DN2681_c0_g1_i2:8-1024(-)
MEARSTGRECDIPRDDVKETESDSLRSFNTPESGLGEHVWEDDHTPHQTTSTEDGCEYEGGKRRISSPMGDHVREDDHTPHQTTSTDDGCEYEERNRGISFPDGSRNRDSNDVLVLENAALEIPGTSRVVVRELSLRLKEGEGMLIIGPSGAGKTSFIRALAGIWPLREGIVSISRHIGEGGVMYLPQKALLTKGGLGAQVLYPNRLAHEGALREGSELRERVLEALVAVGMEVQVARLGGDLEVERPWELILSPGEQQSLALARLFYHRPRLAVLDEATSSIPELAELAAYSLLTSWGIACISISHRFRALQRFHQWTLELLGDGEGAFRHYAACSH